MYYTYLPDYSFALFISIEHLLRDSPGVGAFVGINTSESAANMGVERQQQMFDSKNYIRTRTGGTAFSTSNKISTPTNQ